MSDNQEEKAKALRPFDGREYFFKRTHNPVTMSVEEAREKLIEFCHEHDMEVPSFTTEPGKLEPKNQPKVD